MPKFAEYAQIATAVISEGISLYGVYQNLQPSVKSAVSDELAKVKAAAGEIVTEIAAFRNASWIGKASAGVAVFGAVDDVIDVAETVYKDGATLFAADWPLVQVHFQNIENLVTGKVAPGATPSPAATLTVPAPQAAL